MPFPVVCVERWKKVFISPFSFTSSFFSHFISPILLLIGWNLKGKEKYLHYIGFFLLLYICTDFVVFLFFKINFIEVIFPILQEI